MNFCNHEFIIKNKKKKTNNNNKYKSYSFRIIYITIVVKLSHIYI